MLLSSGKLEVLSKDELHKVHQASVRILQETGVVFESHEVIDIFKRKGCKIEGKTVFIPESIIEQAIESSPNSFTHFARNDKHTIHVGQGQKDFAVSSTYGTVNIQDVDFGRRKGMMIDHINITKLCHESEVVNVIGGVPIDVSDVEQDFAHLDLMYQTIKHTDKAIYSMPGTKKINDEVFAMIEMGFGGKDCFERGCVTAVPVCPLSPLKYDHMGCETLLSYASRGQAVYVNSCVVAGVSGPISLLGTATLMNTEILAALVLTQLIQPGSPFVYVPGSTVGNMKGGIYNTGSPESNLINIVGLQLAIDLYKLPTRAMAGMTDAKVVDCQAGYESMQNFMLLMLAGVHFINEALGCMDSCMTTSYEKFVIDEEMIKRVLKIRDGLPKEDKNVSIELIQEVAHYGEYLTHETTFERCRQRWRPSVSYWDSHYDWVAEGSEDVLKRANRKYKDIIKKSPDMLIDRQLANDLERYMMLTKKR